MRGTVPAGHLGCELKGPDGQFLGSVVWHDRRVGDELLWNMAPLLLVALLAVCLLLFLAIRRVETVVLREGRLSLRSEEHASELQSLMRISYAVFCLKNKK